MSKASMEEGYREFLETSHKHNTIGKLKNVIKGCIQQYDLEEITVICGYKPLYSGSFNGFYSNCDINMVVYRNELLEREVIEKALMSNKKLFVFIQ